MEQASKVGFVIAASEVEGHIQAMDFLELLTAILAANLMTLLFAAFGFWLYG